MRLLDFPVRQWQFTVVVFAMLAALGVSSWLSIPRGEDPPLYVPTFTVIAVYPGASPADLERRRPGSWACRRWRSTERSGSASRGSRRGVLREEDGHGRDVVVRLAGAPRPDPSAPDWLYVASLAWVIIGGLVSSTLLARIVTPVLYKLWPPRVEAKVEP